MKAMITRFSSEFALLLVLAVLVLMAMGLKMPLNYFEFGKSEYKTLSGILLCVFIFDQWKVARLRFVKRSSQEIRAEVAGHKLFGLAGPILFLLHAQRLGHGYFAMLTLSFFGVFLGGSMHEKIVKRKNPLHIRLSLICHIALATVMVGLVIFHIYSLATFGLAPKAK